ncbi:MAG: hypothetical protein JWN77_2607 [Frankiales bacterium]|jgi:hypothetical protein|nr:hypothetical protein [Frankiales bacterium]
MFRDARGVVHTVSSADPLDDLPEQAARALQASLLMPVDGDLGSVLERCDAVRDLVERWQDAFFSSLPDEVDVAEEASWAAKAGMSLAELDAAYEDDDDDDPPLDLTRLDPEAEDLSELLLEPDGEDPRSVLPEELVAVLERELLLLPIRTRLEALVAAADLVSQWSDLLADHEKLLGHLVLAHGQDAASEPHELLADRHASLHAQTGPAHP